MKILSDDAAVAAGNALGEEPFLVVRIDWSSGTVWYADKDTSLARGDILNASALAAQVREASFGSVGEMSFTMDDSDGHFKQHIDTCCPEGTDVTVYQAFESAKSTEDFIVLMKGVMISPEWSEGRRDFSFSVETKVRDLEVGFAVEQDAYDVLVETIPLLTEEAIGRAWPLCFGSNVHVPALRVLAPPETSLNQVFKTGDTQFYVDDASHFPDDESIDVIIDGMVFRVVVDKANNRMIVGEPNVPKYEGIGFASREADDDAANPWVAWIDQDVSLANNFIFFTAENGNSVYHRVVRQEGRKIWMDNRRVQRNPRLGTDFWLPDGFAVVPQPLGPPTIISQVAKCGRDGWGIQMSYVGGATTSNGQLAIGGFRDTAQVISGVRWKFTGGESVRLWAYPAGSHQHTIKNVINLIPCTEIAAVYAWRRNPTTGVRSFHAVPQGYYTVDLSDTVLGHSCATVTLKQPLNDYYAQGWEDRIFVSHKSSVGPNVSDVIKWLLENYSNLAVDDDSFAAVAMACANYPVAIVLEQKQNVLQLCEDIAWKARCALLIEDGVARLKYLSIEPDADYTIDEAVVENHSLMLTNTRIEEIVTHFRANWLLDHSGRTIKSKTLVKTENVAKFGLVKREVDFNIYNVESLVQKSATFWAHRLANAWRYAKLNALKRTAFGLEMLDCVSVDLGILGMAPPKGVLESHSFDADAADQTTFGLSLWLPLLAGTKLQDPQAWLSDAGDTLPADPVDNIHEVTHDEQWSDDLSRHYVNQRPTSYPAKVINASADGLGYNVDVYADGFEAEDGTPLDPTNRDGSGARIPFVAYPIEIGIALDRQFLAGSVINGQDVSGLERCRNLLTEGTKIQVFNAHGSRWLFNVPGDQHHVPAKINGPTADAIGRIGFTTYHTGWDGPAGQTEVKAIYLGDVSSANVGDKCFLFQHGELKFAMPLGGGGTSLRCFKVTVNNADGTYEGLEYDEPDGTLLGDPDHPTPLKEDNGSVDVPVDQFVRAVPGVSTMDVASSGDTDVPILWFNMPFGCPS